MARLTENNYGKSSVRLTKVIRNGATHGLFEMTVGILLGGAFERVYTHGDNSPCIPTDTMKNTVYALARTHDFDSPESFARLLSTHFVESFTQVAWAETSIEQTLWERIPVNGAPHSHAFTGAGSARRTCRVRCERGAKTGISGGIAGLEVIKTTGSGFSGFLKDRFTTLRETEDRLLATSIDAVWDFLGPRARLQRGIRDGAPRHSADIRAARKPQRAADHLRHGRGAARRGARDRHGELHPSQPAPAGGESRAVSHDE